MLQLRCSFAFSLISRLKGPVGAAFNPPTMDSNWSPFPWKWTKNRSYQSLIAESPNSTYHPHPCLFEGTSSSKKHTPFLSRARCVPATRHNFGLQGASCRRETRDEPMDWGVAYFQTNPCIYDNIYIYIYLERFFLRVQHPINIIHVFIIYTIVYIICFI